MKYEFSYSDELGILLVKGTGAWQARPFPKIAERFVEELKTHGCNRALIDYRELVLPDNPVDIYSRPRILSEKAGPTGIIMAVLVKEITQAFVFSETVYQNLGYQVKTFTDRDKALDWLASFKQ